MFDSIFSNNNLLYLHLGSALVADVLVTTAGVVAMLYLTQDAFLKKKKFGTTFRFLPPIHQLDRLSLQLLILAFFLMTLSTASGSYLASQLWGTLWFLDPREIFSVSIWVVFATLLILRLVLGFRGRKAAWITLLGTLSTMIALVGLNILIPTHHVHIGAALSSAGLQ